MALPINPIDLLNGAKPKTTTKRIDKIPTNRNLTQAEVAAVWIAAGGDPSKAWVMSSIAMPESGGNPRIVNKSSRATGLWQINLSDPGSAATLKGGDPTDPIANAKAAIRLSNNGKNLRPWDASKHAWGAKVSAKPGGDFLGSVRSILEKFPSTGALGFLGDALPGGDDPSLDALNPFKWTETVGDVFGRMQVLFEEDFWRRVGLVFLGIGALALAVIMFGREFATSTAGKALKSTVK